MVRHVFLHKTSPEVRVRVMVKDKVRHAFLYKSSPEIKVRDRVRYAFLSVIPL